ncbi:MAG: hypothetical protein IH627_05090 [Rubrivivax sp.]|nr:hypothetical protein [Rubrivivax sp.]
MPFDTFNGLTAGAFAEHRVHYEAVAPVFYRGVLAAGMVPTVPLPPPAPRNDLLQIKWRKRPKRRVAHASASRSWQAWRTAPR